MSWIRVIHENEAAEGAAKGRLQRLYRACLDPEYGEVDNILKVHSLRPETLDGHLRLYTSIMKRDTGLSFREREVIGVVVSAVNSCHY